MKLRMRFVWGAVLGCCLSISTTQANDPEMPPLSPKDEVIKLFDGRTLHGFYTYLSDTEYDDPRRVFRITDGLLHITGDGLGSLTTKNSYANYHLVLEFKWGKQTWKDRVSSAKDSGLLIHSVGPDGAYSGIWMHSIEVQIIQGGIGDFVLVSGTRGESQELPISLTCEVDRDRDGEAIWKRGGIRQTFNRDNRQRINWYGRDPNWDDKIGFRGLHDLEKRDGEWNRMDVICDEGHIQTFLNETLVNEAFDAYPSAGKIQLQAELAEIFFRRFELWPIGQEPKLTNP